MNPNGQQITGARISISNIRTWDANANRLFIHLLDSARNAGVNSFIDDPAPCNTNVSIIDDFVNTRFHSQSNWRVAVCPVCADCRDHAKS